jgi:nicastrin
MVQVEVREASLRNPGIPPSSLMSFLRVKPRIAGAVLEDFDARFSGGHYQSRLDADISTEALTSAALVAARALHEVALGNKDVPPLKVRDALSFGG